MKNVYVYDPTPLELMTRQASLKLNKGDKVRLSKAPAGGRGLPGVFRWVEDMDGNFLGMVTAHSLKKAKGVTFSS